MKVEDVSDLPTQPVPATENDDARAPEEDTEEDADEAADEAADEDAEKTDEDAEEDSRKTAPKKRKDSLSRETVTGQSPKKRAKGADSPKKKGDKRKTRSK